MQRLIRVLSVVAFAIAIVALFFWASSLCSCVSEAERYVRLRYPHCDVKLKEKTSKEQVFLISCPGQETFERSYREKQ